MSIYNNEEQELIEKLKTHPTLKAYFLEMINIVEGEKYHALKIGDDAEEAVVNAVQKTGKALLQEWVEKKHIDVNREASDVVGARRHKKKL